MKRHSAPSEWVRDCTEWFKTVVGVLHGFVLSLFLFCIFLEVVTARNLEDDELGVHVLGAQINNFKFADDIALVAESKDDFIS